MNTNTTTPPKKRGPRKQAYKPIVAITAELITRLIKKGPQTDAQIRAALPNLHSAALCTLVRNGFISEVRSLAEKTSVYQAAPKGREAVKLRRQWLAKQFEQACAESASANKAAEAAGQLALDLAVAKPRTYFAAGTYSGEELRRNPYRAPMVVAQEIVKRTSANYGLETA